MSSRQLDEEAIFHIARKLDDPADRVKYLDQICAGDQGLCDRVEALLRVHEDEQRFLKSAPADAAATIDHTPLTERAGVNIGRYRLMEQIGEGGMGAVFVAEQDKPIRRRVALKVIKPGMDSKAVIARFEAERQALALMDHPNIAKVLDAGTTETARPYFVMELVRGIPITLYCDEHKLSIHGRLEQFVQVCQAVQHAHQKGIIHRDIKPTNVLVTEQDGKAVPKVIDFGVAKAINHRLTERTVYTTFAQVVGTPLYMSPEQAALSAVDVDTRSDVYSLGVLLYELLTGTTPFDRKRFETAAYDEIRRIVREEEPPKPSTKITTLGKVGRTVAQNRRTEHEKLMRTVRGDLDWIAMTALEKDRGRRYSTPAALIDDVQRFLGNEPVRARPPSTTYQLQKFVQRHRSVVTAAVAVTVVLLLGLIGTTTALLWAKSERRIAQQEKHRAEVVARERASILSSYRSELEMNAMEAILSGRFKDAQEFIRDAQIVESSDETIAWLRGLADVYAGRPEYCIVSLERYSSLSVAAHATLASAYLQSGRVNEFIDAVTDLETRDPDSDPAYLLLGEALIFIDTLRAESLLQQAIHRRESVAARISHSHALAIRAMLSRDLDLARKAVEQIGAAETFWPEQVRVREVSVFVHDVARRLSVGREREEYASRALLASEADGFSPNGELYRFLFLDGIGKTDQARESLVRASYHGDAACRLAPFLLNESRVDALRTYRNLALPARAYTKGGEAFLLALSSDSQQDAIRLCDDITAEFTDFDVRLDMLCVCLLSGDENVANKSRSLLPSSRGRFWTCDKALEYLAGDVQEEELLQYAEAHFFGSHVAEYTIGVRMLSEGNREEAVRLLRRCATSSNFHSAYPRYARAILKQMDEDHAWPPWLLRRNHDRQSSAP